MSAVRRDRAMIEKICRWGDRRIVSIANYNCQDRLPITGRGSSVSRKSFKPLKQQALEGDTSEGFGPFHSKCLQVQEKLGEVLKDVVLQEVEFLTPPIFTAQYVKRIRKKSKDLLVAQVSSSVRWQRCVRTMIADGVDTFCRDRPGKP